MPFHSSTRLFSRFGFVLFCRNRIDTVSIAGVAGLRGLGGVGRKGGAVSAWQGGGARGRGDAGRGATRERGDGEAGSDVNLQR